MTPTATAAIRESDLVRRSDRDLPPPSGLRAYNVQSQQWPGQLLTVLPDGTFGHSTDENGQYALCYRSADDQKVFWNCAGSGGNFYPTGSFGMPVAVGL